MNPSLCTECSPISGICLTASKRRSVNSSWVKGGEAAKNETKERAVETTETKSTQTRYVIINKFIVCVFFRCTGGKLAGKAHDSDTPDETTPTAPPSVEDHNSQYSPSISHDEEVPNDEVDDWEASTNKPNDWSPDQDNGRKEQDEDSEEWEDFGDDSGASVGGDSVRSGASVGGVWGDSVKSEANNPAPPPRTTSNSGRMKLKRTGSNTSSTQVSVASSDLRSPTSGLSGSSEGGRSPQVLSRESSAGFRNAMKGRLSETDLARLEAKSEWGEGGLPSCVCSC